MLKRYQIEKEISYLIHKNVSLAIDSQTEKQVVIKILYFDLYSEKPFSEEDLKQLATEAEALKNLSHPNVPNYLDHFIIEEENRRGYALVQEYVDAPSLAELFDRGINFSEAETIQLAKEILNILDCLHGLNSPVIHHNLKPSNILLTNRSGNKIGDLYLVNFGSVKNLVDKKLNERRRESSRCGGVIVPYLPYTSPEQYLGKISFSSDIYSLGITLIHLVTDTEPKSLPRSRDTGKVILDRSQVSRSFLHWLNKIAEPDVRGRYQSAAIALEALNSVHADKFLNSKPKSSQIKVNKNRQKLEIIYPTPSSIINWRSPYLTTLFIWLCFVAIYSITAFGYSLFLILFAFSFISSKLYKYRIIQISKNPSNIVEGFCQDNRKKNTFEKTVSQPIEQVIYRPSYTSDKYSSRFRRSASRARIKVDAKLSLLSDYSKTEVFSLQTVKAKTVEITEADLLWLGGEISDFLDLRLQIDSQTSKVVSTS